MGSIPLTALERQYLGLLNLSLLGRCPLLCHGCQKPCSFTHVVG